ncbi:PHP domain-containing protein [bacterium]|nr:PHP domain-containing protein [bacterium]
MNIDLHTHSRYSHSSSLPVEFLIEQGKRPENPVIVCTDHCDDHAVDRLREALPETIIVPAIEVDAIEADLLVFSTNVAYIHKLCAFRGSILDMPREDETAIVWAHPSVSQRTDLRGFDFPAEGPWANEQEEFISRLVRHVDALEVYNGTMLSLAACGLVNPLYFKNLAYLAERYDLARTGGSDAHEVETWHKVWTVFPADVRNAADVIGAIKRRETRPDYDQSFFSTNGAR